MGNMRNIWNLWNHHLELFGGHFSFGVKDSLVLMGEVWSLDFLNFHPRFWSIFVGGGNSGTYEQKIWTLQKSHDFPAVFFLGCVAKVTILVHLKAGGDFSGGHHGCCQSRKTPVARQIGWVATPWVRSCSELGGSFQRIGPEKTFSTFFRWTKSWGETFSLLLSGK